MRDKMFLTVDSGGSKTKLALYTVSGDLVKDGICKGFGKAADTDEIIPALATALQEFCAGDVPDVVVGNLGGKNKTEFFNTLKQTFPDSKITVFRESEGEIGRVLCDIYGAEVTLMAGTGSIAIASIGDNTVICGGWGANISDKGSGYQLGLDAIRYVLEEVDGTAEFSTLTKTMIGENHPPKLLTAQAYCEYRDRIRQRLAPFERSHIAGYAKIVYMCAKNGDAISLSLYKKVGEDLADIVCAAIAKTGVPLTNIVVTGGMVNSKEFWQKSFENRLKQLNTFQKVFYIAEGIDIAMCTIAKKEIKE